MRAEGESVAMHASAIFMSGAFAVQTGTVSALDVQGNSETSR